MISHKKLVETVEGKKNVWKKQIYERVFNFANKLDLEKVIRDQMVANYTFVGLRLPINKKYRSIISDDEYWDTILSLFKNKLDNSFYIDYIDYVDEHQRIAIMISWNKSKKPSSVTNFLKHLLD